MDGPHFSDSGSPLDESTLVKPLYFNFGWFPAPGGGNPSKRLWSHLKMDLDCGLESEHTRN